MEPFSSPLAFSLMVKPSGALCNLSCSYCYYLSKNTLYPKSRFHMSDEVLEEYLSQYLDSQHASEVTIAWQGGEPTLMGLQFFRRSVELTEKYRKPGLTIQHTMQTNGTLLDDEWGAFLSDHNFLIGLSIDGPPPIHNRFRVDKGGKPSFNRVQRGLEFLKKHNVEFNILCTVHAANGDHPLEVYRFFRDYLGVQFIQFIPIVERADTAAIQDRQGMRRLARARVTQRSIRPKQFGNFLVAVFDEWVRRDVGRVYVQYFDAALASWVGAPPALCILAPTCGTAPVMEHNGDLYSCDHFVDPTHLLGNIRETSMTELVLSEKQRRFGLDKRDTLPGYCRRCQVRFACHGECPKNRFMTSPDGEPGLNYLCTGYRAFFSHIDRPMRIMAELLRQGRAPAEVSEVLRQEAQLQGRLRQGQTR